MTIYNITITSDIVCPWCYIGHTRLSKAITSHKSQFPTDTFNLHYRPFYLKPPSHLSTGSPAPPPFPVPSHPRRQFMVESYGAARAHQLETSLSQVARAEGLTFAAADGLTGPSRNGHRLVHYAQTHGGEQAQNDVMLGLWRRYFEQGVDITTLDVLVEVGVESGLGTDVEVREFLESGRGGEEVDRLAALGRRDGVTGVPHYLVQDLWVVNGAQEPVAFEMLFKRYKQMEEGKEEGRDGKVGRGNGCL